MVSPSNPVKGWPSHVNDSGVCRSISSPGWRSSRPVRSLTIGAVALLGRGGREARISLVTRWRSTTK